MDNNFSQEQIDNIIDMYKNNIDIDTIIAKYNTDEHCVREVLKSNQVDRQYNKFADELNKRLIYLYDVKKYVQSRICYDLLVSEVGIKKILNRNGIKKRTPSEYNKKYARNSNYFDVIDTENKAYFLGLLYADGNNCSPHNSITLSLQEEDGYLIEQFKNEIGYEGPIHYDRLHDKNPRHKNQVRITLNDEHMSRQLYNLGIVDNKSLILKFPTFLRDDLLRHFIRGFFDGDGGVYHYERLSKMSTNTTSTLEFLTAIRNIMSSFGCKSNITHPKRYLNHNTYVLLTCGNVSSLRYLSWMYEDCEIKMLRKYNVYLFAKENYGTNKNLINPNEVYE